MRRLFHAVFAILSITCFLACLYAINWIWTFKKPAIEKTTYGFEQAEGWLNVADRAMDDVKVNLIASRNRVELVQQAAAPRAPENAQGLLSGMVARAAIKQLTPDVMEAQRTVEKVTEASIVVNSILESLQDMEIESIDKLNVEQVRSLQTTVGGVTKASWELGDLLTDAEGPSDGESAAAKSRRIAHNLDVVIALMKEVQQRIQALRGRVQVYRSNTLYWLNNGPTLATAVLSWIAISQLVVLVVAVRGFKRHD